MAPISISARLVSSVAHERLVNPHQAACAADPVGDQMPAFLAGALEKRGWTNDLVPVKLRHISAEPGDQCYLAHVPRSSFAAAKQPHYVYELVRRMLPPAVAIFSKGTTADDFIDDLMDRFFKPACPAPTAPSLAAPPGGPPQPKKKKCKK